MKFSVEWLQNAPNRAPEERVTAADLKICIGERNAALHIVRSKSSDSIRMPIYNLAEGITLDWWRLFGSREEEISLKLYRNGYAVPDVRMRFDGAAFEVRARQIEYSNPPVRFWEVGTETLSRKNAEEVLRNLIERALGQLREFQIEGTTAELRWARICTSLKNADERAFCEAAGALGEDPYEISNEMTAVIENFANIFKGEALVECLAGARCRSKDKLLEWIGHVRKMPNYISRLERLSGLALEAAQAAQVIDGERGWARGYRRARACRKALSLDETRRIKTYKELAKLLGNKNFQPKVSVDGIRALREDDSRGIMIHLRSSSAPTAQSEMLFSLARGVGDAACFPEADIAPINDLSYAYRQQCGRAFAAEFLAPIHEVLSMRKDGHDNLTIAGEFGVSELVVAHQLENEQRIEVACAAQ